MYLLVNLLQSSVEQPLLLLQVALAPLQHLSLQVSLLQPLGELVPLLAEASGSSLGLLQLRLQGAVLVLQHFHRLLSLRAAGGAGVKL